MNVGEMQRKLSLWAEQDKERKFYDLYSLLCNDTWLRLAHDYVAQNAGSRTAGCDGITMRLFDERLEENLRSLAEELRAGTFQPLPVRRVLIPKADGRHRPLGIGAIRDRIVQEALRMILEPIYEADFSQTSFGFRPLRRTMDAIRCITWSTTERKKFFWVIEGDLCSYFDTIHHRRLVKILRRRIEDERIIKLIWKFLRAGVMEGKLFKDSRRGVPQGGIVSPLLANVYLHELDKYLEKYTGLAGNAKTRRRAHGLANFSYVRYADDFVVLCNGTKAQAEALKEELSGFLNQTLRLRLSEEKTKITHLNDGVEFLGFKLQRCRGQKGMTTKILIPGEAIRSFRDKIKEATAATTYRDSAQAKITALNRIISGWCRYYQYTSWASTRFNELGTFVFWRMVHWLGRKFKMRTPAVLRRFYCDDHFSIAGTRLILPSEYSSQSYRERFFKANPYTTHKVTIQRETLYGLSEWSGYETRPGATDLRQEIIRRDSSRCQLCDKSVTADAARVDHIKPVRRFKRPVDANDPRNLWTLCHECHCWKTQSDRQMESRMH